jgi:hypothetical protein
MSGTKAVLLESSIRAKALDTVGRDKSSSIDHCTASQHLSEDLVGIPTIHCTLASRCQPGNSILLSQGQIAYTTIKQKIN